MAATIECTQMERDAVLTAICMLNGNRVVKYMSYKMIANEAGIPESKARIAVNELLNDGKIDRIVVNNKRVPRYYYVLVSA